MKQKVLIVEDQFIEANDLELMLLKCGYEVAGIATSYVEALAIIGAGRPDFVLVDIFIKGQETGIDLAVTLQEKNIPFVYVSANSNREVLMAAKATQPYGFIVKPFRERDLIVTLEIAQYRFENSAEANMRKEEELGLKLREIADSRHGWEQKMLSTAKALQRHIPFDYMVAGFRTTGDVPYNAVSYLRIGFDEYQVIGLPELSQITRKSMKEMTGLQAATPIETMPKIVSGDDFAKMIAKPSMRRLVAEQFRMNSLLVFPIDLNSGQTFYFYMYSRNADIYRREHLLLLKTFKNILILAIERMLLVEKTPALGTLQSKATQVPDKRKINIFEGIVGKSHLLLHVFDCVSQVAPADTSVLILGESGTGKERIAQCIHDMSGRSKGPMVRINCAALPASLIESELFGHEKGAFTGAVDKRIGKFELADKGTVFLDELGEMPLELQAKLLRVLQEREIERVGGNVPIRINVRIIAATNRDLEKEVAAGRFRLDLYYRLNIFPIHMPALRNRREDIPLLADHFVRYFNRKLGKSVSGLSKEALRGASAYHWPGNIRELENLIERGMLLTRGDVIHDLQLPEAVSYGGFPEMSDAFQTIEANEREHIKRALKKCNGKVWGSGGAAELLGLPASTLNSRMKKLGINRDFLLG